MAKKKPVFSRPQIAEIARITRITVEQYIGKNTAFFRALAKDEVLQVMANMIRTPAVVPVDNDFIIISEKFDNPNADTMKVEINEWLLSVGALEIIKMEQMKSPTSNFGIEKTIFVKIKKPVTTGTTTPNAESTPQGD